MTDEQRWEADGRDFGWTLPAPATWPLRLPIIRHIRALIVAIRVERHEALWRSMGAIPSGYDRWVLYGIVKGKC